MRAPGSPLGTLACAGAALLFGVASARLLLVSLPVDGSIPPGASTTALSWIDSLPRPTNAVPHDHDPFAWADPVLYAFDTSGEEDFAPPLFVRQEVPGIVGVGRRRDGTSFVGCEVPGDPPRVVRVGDLCGSFRLVAVIGDSVHLMDPASDSLVVLGVGT